MQTDANLRRRLSFRFENHIKSPLKIEKEKTASINNKRNMNIIRTVKAPCVG